MITTDPNGFQLEDGIWVAFSGTRFRQGDYWLVPARVATGDVEWPRDEKGPVPMPPSGVVHYYAPLAIVTLAGTTGLRHQLPQPALIV